MGQKRPPARLSDLAVPVSLYSARSYDFWRVTLAETLIFQYNLGMVPTLTATTPSAPTAAKSMLARLLAAENISVVHQNIPTAFFDLKTRSLHLPLWSNASGALYDMLVGHEVAHALFTPANGWRTAIDAISAATGCEKDTAKQYLNIVEDARIERMIQAKFRGLKSDFIGAYKTLMEREFFGDISNPNSMIFADRFNLHFKCGVHAGTVIRFSAEEAVFVTRGETVATWADVVALAQDMITYAQEQAAKAQQQDQQAIAAPSDEGDEDGEDGEGVDAEGETGEPQDGDTEANNGSGKGDESQSDSQDQSQSPGDKPSDSQEDGKSAAKGNNAKRVVNNEMQSSIAPQTNQNLQKALEAFAKTSDGVDEIVRVSADNLSQSARVVDFKTVLSDMRSSAMSRFMGAPVRIADYTTASTTMATAFNRRKAADNWRRTSVAKTGSLDTLRMNQYKWNEDIFRRTTRIADGKNHGIVILLDWSSSMSPIMQSTIGQLFILADFCRKVGVPFEVYAFSDQMYTNGKDYLSATAQQEREAAWEADHQRRKNAQLVTRDVTMLNFLSSRMNGAEYEAAKTCLWNWRQMGTCDHRYALNGTPTTAALVAAADLVESFVKRTRVQIAHTVVLTDGEPTDCIDFNMDAVTGTAASNRDYSKRSAVVIADPRTGATYDLSRLRKYTKDEYGYRKFAGYFQFGSEGIPETVQHPHAMIAADIIRRRTGAKIHWIGLTTHRKSIDPSHYGMVCKDNNWKRDGFIRGDVWGWDSAIVVDADRFLREANGEVSRTAQQFLDKAEERMDAASTKGALAKAFMETQIAQGSLRTVATHIGECLAV